MPLSDLLARFARTARAARAAPSVRSARSVRCARALPKIILALLAVAAFSACDSEAPGSGGPAAPAADDVALESSVLASGDEGILVSNAFSGLALRAASLEYEDGTPIPDRWTNFRVLVDGEEVGSRRLDETRIAFDVLVLVGGTHAVEVVGAGLATSFSARVLGVVASGQILPCLAFESISFTPVGDALYFGLRCSFFPGDPRSRQGIAEVLPQVPGREFRWVPGSDVEFADTSLNRAHVRTGPSVRPSSFVGRLPGPNSAPPSLWVWKAGGEPAPLEPLSCIASGEPGGSQRYNRMAPAEPSPGVCLVFLTEGRILRDGAPIAECCRSDFDVHFVMADDGWSVLRQARQLVTLDAAGEVRYLEDAESGLISDARFSASGAELYVLRELFNEDSFLQVVDRGTGEGLRERVFPPPSRLVALAPSAAGLWLARTTDGLGSIPRQGRLLVELYDPDTLELRRRIVVSNALTGGLLGWPFHGASPILRADPNGKRLYFTGHVDDNIGALSHIIEVS